MDIYKIDDSFQGNALSTNLFESLIKEAGPNADIIEGRPAYTNAKVLKETGGDVSQTPWAKVLDKLGYDTIYDEADDLMISTKRK